MSDKMWITVGAILLMTISVHPGVIEKVCTLDQDDNDLSLETTKQWQEGLTSIANVLRLLGQTQMISSKLKVNLENERQTTFEKAINRFREQLLNAYFSATKNMQKIVNYGSQLDDNIVETELMYSLKNVPGAERSYQIFDDATIRNTDQSVAAAIEIINEFENQIIGKDLNELIEASKDGEKSVMQKRRANVENKSREQKSAEEHQRVKKSVFDILKNLQLGENPFSNWDQFSQLFSTLEALMPRVKPVHAQAPDEKLDKQKQVDRTTTDTATDKTTDKDLPEVISTTLQTTSPSTAAAAPVNELEQQLQRVTENCYTGNVQNGTRDQIKKCHQALSKLAKALKPLMAKKGRSQPGGQSVSQNQATTLPATTSPAPPTQAQLLNTNQQDKQAEAEANTIKDENDIIEAVDLINKMFSFGKRDASVNGQDPPLVPMLTLHLIDLGKELSKFVQFVRQVSDRAALLNVRLVGLDDKVYKFCVNKALKYSSMMARLYLHVFDKYLLPGMSRLELVSAFNEERDRQQQMLETLYTKTVDGIKELIQNETTAYDNWVKATKEQIIG